VSPGALQRGRTHADGEPHRYSPLFPVDKRNGDILWEIWIEGFKRPSSADADTAAAMHGMLTLLDVAQCDDPVAIYERDSLIATAPDAIKRWIPTLNAWRLANHDPSQAATLVCRPSAANSKKNRAQQSLSLRIRQEMQEVLRTSLNTAIRGPHHLSVGQNFGCWRQRDFSPEVESYEPGYDSFLSTRFIGRVLNE
jgi:hypothetical protein